MGLRQDIKPFVDLGGLICPLNLDARDMQQSSGNGLRELGLYYLTLKQRDELQAGDYSEFRNTVLSCTVYPWRGLLKRSRINTDQESFDDYIAVTAAAHYLAPELAREIYSYGQRGVSLGPLKLKYVYNNVRPGTLEKADGGKNWSAWLGRNPSFVAHLKWCAGLTPTWWERLAWEWAIASCGRSNPESQDEWVLSWLLLQVGRSKSMTNIRLHADWGQRLYKHWPGGIGQVLERYYGFPHPIAKYFVS